MEVELLNNLHDLGVDLGTSGVWDCNARGFRGFLTDPLGVVLFAELLESLSSSFTSEKYKDVFEFHSRATALNQNKL